MKEIEINNYRINEIKTIKEYYTKHSRGGQLKFSSHSPKRVNNGRQTPTEISTPQPQISRRLGYLREI
jgi:hypothetical protein